MELPTEVAKMAENVSAEKRNDVQIVLNNVFNGVSIMRNQLDTIVVADVNDKTNMKLANTIRLGVRQIRLDAEKVFDAKRAEVQQEMLSYKTEDSLWLKSKQIMQILTKEIEENARWKEETKERIEAEIKELKIQERINEVSKYAGINRIEFELMSDDSFDSFLNGLKTTHTSKIEAERKAEQDRIEREKADAEEREQQKLENERLKIEAENREKEIEAERKINDKKLAEEKEKLKIEQDAKAKLEAELKAKKDADDKAENERKQAELKAIAEAEKNAKAPIKKQLLTWTDSFSIAEINIENDKTILIKEKFESFKKWAKREIESI